MSRTAWVAFACLVLASCSSQTPPTPVATGTARFDWFHYEGNDSVYRSARPGPNDYLNPILAGFYPDPTIVRSGTDYYVATSSFVQPDTWPSQANRPEESSW